MLDDLVNSTNRTREADSKHKPIQGPGTAKPGAKQVVATAEEISELGWSTPSLSNKCNIPHWDVLMKYLSTVRVKLNIPFFSVSPRTAVNVYPQQGFT